MNHKPIYPSTGISSYIFNVAVNILPGIWGIQIIVPVLLPVRTGDKRFNR